MKCFQTDSRFEVFTTVNFQVEVFCIVVPCSVVVGYHVSEDCAASVFIKLKMEAPCPSVTSVSYHITTRRHNLEDLDLDSFSVKVSFVNFLDYLTTPC